MRDTSIDYLKGIAVLLMVIVHPLMMTTNLLIDNAQAILASTGYLLTQPVAGMFLFALGYAMSMKRRPFFVILKRTFVILFFAIAFGVMIKFISEGPFFFSVFFTASILVAIVGFLRIISKDMWVIMLMASLSIFVALVPLFNGIVSVLPAQISGAIRFPESKELMSFYTWDVPLLPYLIPGLYGGMLAISHRAKSFLCSMLPHLSLFASLIISIYAYNYGLTLYHTVIIICLSPLYPLLLFVVRRAQKGDYDLSPVAGIGRHVTFIYFTHHILIALFCVLTVGVSFNYNSYYLINSGLSSISPILILILIGSLITGSFALSKYHQF